MKSQINADGSGLKSDFMERLFEEVVVEWKPLGSLGEFVRGNGL